MKKLLFKKLDPRAVRAYNSAGFDLCALGDEVLNTTTVINTGLAVVIPEGYVGLIWDRSSLGRNGITVFGGCIDSDYRGEIKVILHNSGSWTRSYLFLAGAKIAQLLIVPIPDLTVEEVDDLPATERGERGFGSSDKERQNG